MLNLSRYFWPTLIVASRFSSQSDLWTSDRHVEHQWKSIDIDWSVDFVCQSIDPSNGVQPMATLWHATKMYTSVRIISVYEISAIQSISYHTMWCVHYVYREIEDFGDYSVVGYRTM